jgi:AraC-like DNA-binding protein
VLARPRRGQELSQAIRSRPALGWAVWHLARSAYPCRRSLALAEDASFRFFPARPPLATFVDYFFCSEVPRGFIRSIDGIRLPEIEAQLVFVIEDGNEYPGGCQLGGGLRASLFLQPAHLQMVAIPDSICLAVGVSLRPAGLRILLPKGFGSVLDTPRIALEDLLGEQARDLLERLALAHCANQRCILLHDFLLARAARVPLPSRPLLRALELIQAKYGEVSTEQVARTCGWSSRALRNAALAETGLAPKHLARVARIRRAVDLLSAHGVALSETAMAAAFSDQAHMNREFRELIGVTPLGLSQRIRTPLPAHTAERDLMSTGLLVIPKVA